MKRLLPSWRNYCSILAVGLLIFALSTTALAQQSGVSINQNGASPHESAILDVQSTSKGLLPPRMTTAERDAIANPTDGLQIFNTTTACPNYFYSGDWYEWCGIIPPGSITTLDCAGATINGTLTDVVAASGVSAEIGYTGGDGGPHSGQTVTSTGVTGLTATLSAGNFANGAGTLTYNITGTPGSVGTASFAIGIGGESCVLEVTVDSLPFTCGTSMVTFTYNGSSVTYGTVENITTGECWLDRNLGASQVAASSTDANSYGDLFQWGRADDGHQLIDRTAGVPISGTTPTLSTTDQPTHGTFIRTSSLPFDWRSDNNNNRWNASPMVNNPCPSGWRVPTEAEWDAERSSWSSNNSAGAFASPLKLPVAGGRNGSDGSVGTNGRYWSSTVSSTGSIRLGFTSSNAFMSTFSRAHGFSVRCLKD